MDKPPDDYFEEKDRLARELEKLLSGMIGPDHLPPRSLPHCNGFIHGKLLLFDFDTSSIWEIPFKKKILD